MAWRSNVGAQTVSAQTAAPKCPASLLPTVGQREISVKPVSELLKRISSCLSLTYPTLDSSLKQRHVGTSGGSRRCGLYYTASDASRLGARSFSVR